MTHQNTNLKEIIAMATQESYALIMLWKPRLLEHFLAKVAFLSPSATRPLNLTLTPTPPPILHCRKYSTPQYHKSISKEQKQSFKVAKSSEPEGI